MSEPALAAAAPSYGERDQRVFLRGVSWQQYETIEQIRGDRRHPRLTYLEGDLELMSPGRDHERLTSFWARLLELWALEADAPVYAYGSWTLKREDVQRGAEPDRCYTVGDGDEGKAVPDLALEVVWSHDDPGKLAVYAGLGVREVWVWKASRIAVHVLRGGAYVDAPRSELVPSLDLALLARFVERTDQPRALREYRAALRPTPR